MSVISCRSKTTPESHHARGLESRWGRQHFCTDDSLEKTAVCEAPAIASASIASMRRVWWMWRTTRLASAGVIRSRANRAVINAGIERRICPPRAASRVRIDDEAAGRRGTPAGVCTPLPPSPILRRDQTFADDGARTSEAA